MNPERDAQERQIRASDGRCDPLRGADLEARVAMRVAPRSVPIPSWLQARLRAAR